ncbi:MAG: 2-polyprenyl-6-methoxyphenol hydroxylase-like oxidoreductase [Rhodospirillales bacterium]|nr:2-polyprenyl-6-methoxyphenol hydroxylase-like oxidoreductase [Rhodospirillales bacterium]
MSKGPSIAILGAGMGGLTAAASLRRRGYSVRIYEQASKFVRLGAGIQMSPNAMQVLRGLGLEPYIRSIAFQPKSWMNREWETGAMKFDLALGAAAEAQYAAPYLLMHRGDLHTALASLVPEELIELNKRLVDFDQTPSGVVMRFEDGSTACADALIAADGVHSRVREIILGPEQSKFSGRVAYRTTFPASLLNGYSIDECTKWWGPDRHIVIYFVTAPQDEVYFVTSNPEPDWTRESWSATGDLDELRAAFVGFHDQVQRVLRACPKVHKWALVERDPLPRWSVGNVVLLGDACHPMTPYMAQGAATSMEDAVVLSRCIEAEPDIAAAFLLYEAARKPRTSKIQLTSHMNTWMRQRTDPSWVYGYDAWSTPLQAEQGSPANAAM